MPHIRRAAVFAVALALSVFSALPHQHDDLVERWQKPIVEQTDICATPNAQHIHPAKPAQPHSCTACLRQHSPVTLHLVPFLGARLRAVTTIALAIADPRRALVLLTSSRGPPV